MRVWLPISFAVALTPQMYAQPAIATNGIVNATGYQFKLAPDTLFMIFGSALGPASIATASAPNYPAMLAGTSIAFTPAAGGAAIQAKMVYTFATQVAGLLPSSIAPGIYAVQVTYNSQTSAARNVTVLARSFGIATSNSAGTGTAQATIGNVNGGLSLTRFTSGSLASGGFNWTLTPSHPGDSLVFWGTGGGADPANDTGGSSGDQTAVGGFVVNVGGRQITPKYAGTSSGYPGLWQINFTLPANITPDCFAFAQVSAGGELGNSVSIPIAAAGQSTCSTPGFSPAALAKLDAGGNIVSAGLTVGKVSIDIPDAPAMVIEQVGGQVARYSATEWILPYSGPKFGPCAVFDVTYPSSGKFPAAPDALLDAGSKLVLSGPNVPVGFSAGSLSGPSGPLYTNNLPLGTLTAGGVYTLTGAGGTQVGAFSGPATPPTSFTVTNLSSLGVIDRSQPLTITWTGAGFDAVLISLTSATSADSVTHQVVVSCAVPASPGAYTIPAAALAYLPPVSGSQMVITATSATDGVVSSQSSTAQTLTPPLVGGSQADFGSFTAFSSFVKTVAIQ